MARAVIDGFARRRDHLLVTPSAPYGPRAISAGALAIEPCRLKRAGLARSQGGRACNTATTPTRSLDARERFWIDGAPEAIHRHAPYVVIGTASDHQSEAYLRALAAVPGLTV